MTSYLSGVAIRKICGKYSLFNSSPLFISVRNETHYDVLKLPRSCSPKDVREAFISLSKENHPDKHQNDPSMHIRFVKINEAYRTLIKPSSRRSYDVSLSFKRKLSPPHYANNSRAERREHHGFNEQYPNDFSEPFMWNNTKTTQQTNNNNYYGIKGVKKVSNTVIVWFVFAFTIVGVLFQIVIIRSASSWRSEQMLKESRKNSILESMLREKAKLYGNEHQIQVLKNSLKATCDVIEDGITES